MKINYQSLAFCSSLNLLKFRFSIIDGLTEFTNSASLIVLLGLLISLSLLSAAYKVSFVHCSTVVFKKVTLDSDLGGMREFFLKFVPTIEEGSINVMSTPVCKSSYLSELKNPFKACLEAQ